MSRAAFQPARDVPIAVVPVVSFACLAAQVPWLAFSLIGLQMEPTSAWLTRFKSPNRSSLERSECREKPRKSQNSTETSVSRGASIISGSVPSRASMTTGEKN